MRSSEAGATVDQLSPEEGREVRSKRRGILFGLGACVILFGLLLVSPQAARDDEPSANETKASLNKQQGRIRGRSLMAAYWSIAEGFQSSLMLTNTSEDLLRITPEVYSLTGQKLEMPEIRLGAHERMVLDMRTWLTNGQQGSGEQGTQGHGEHLIDDQRRTTSDQITSGSLILHHRGGTYALAAQLTISDPARSLSFDFPVEPSFYKYESTTLDGLWWLVDSQSEARLILTNLSDNEVNIRASFTLNGKGHVGAPLALDPHQTRVMGIDEALKLAKAERGRWMQGGLRFEHDGEPGDLRAYCLMWNRRGFSTTMELVDPAARVSRSLHAAGVLLRQMSVPGLPQTTKFNMLLVEGI
ncbi:MAG: hypothetical protein ABIN58_06750 [candidate division WOR-3 bacterium]